MVYTPSLSLTCFRHQSQVIPCHLQLFFSSAFKLYYLKIVFFSDQPFPASCVVFLQLLLIYKSPKCLLPSFKSIGLSVHEKKRKIDFQDGHHGGHLGFQIGTILTIFLFKSHLNASYQVLGLMVQEKKRKINFQDDRHGSHLGYPIGTILYILDLQVTPMLPTKFRVNWPRGVGEVVNC